MSSRVRALTICLIPLKFGRVLPTLNVITAAALLITVTAFEFFVMPNSPVHFEADSTQEKRNILILTSCMLKKKQTIVQRWSVPTFAGALLHLNIKHLFPV